MTAMDILINTQVSSFCGSLFVHALSSMVWLPYTQCATGSHAQRVHPSRAEHLDLQEIKKNQKYVRDYNVEGSLGPKIMSRDLVP